MAHPAAGGTFAAFPLVFSKMFTFLYLPMILLLIGLIARGISVEYLHKDDNPRIQKGPDVGMVHELLMPAYSLWSWGLHLRTSSRGLKSFWEDFMSVHFSNFLALMHWSVVPCSCL